MKNLVNVNQLFSRKEAKTKLSKIIQFPLSRIIIAILFIIPAIMLNNVFTIYVLETLENPLLIILQVGKAIPLIAFIIYLYHLYTKNIEHREAFEFNFKNWLKEFWRGIVMGGGMVILITVLLFLFGSYNVDHLNSPLILVNRFFRYAQGSFIEDVLFTLIMFKLIEEFAGTTISYIIVSLFFGGMHLMNDNATITSSLFISIQQITLLAPFILTRRMWMGWAVHFSWNFFQAGVFGMSNSGMDHGGFITPIISGPEWLTGGSFGIEGSWISLIVNLAVGIPLLIYAFRAKQIVKPSWKRINKQPL